jgi:hypothetical protein
VSSRELTEKIESLPADKRAEVEEFVDSLTRHDRGNRPGEPQPAHSGDLFDRISERRERLQREHGMFDTLPLIQELRDSGGR